jgi:hypothetical protein
MTKLLLSLLVVPLLTACPKLDELNRTLNGEPPKPATTSTSTAPKVTAKRFVPSDCGYVEPHTCKPDEYGLYYTDDTYSAVSKETYEKAQIGDPK